MTTTGIWLLQLGTPDEPSASACRRYLREFLSDPRVIDIPTPLRWLFVNLFVVPFRSPKTAKAYRKIWASGAKSPLLHYSEQFTIGLQKYFHETAEVRLSMRYQNPSMEEGWKEWKRLAPQRILIVPLYPQYSSAATGSSLERVFEFMDGEETIPSISVVPAFYNVDPFIDIWVRRARAMQIQNYDHLLISFHGLPERQIKKADPSQSYCLIQPDCCNRSTIENPFCYRAQCFHTAQIIANRLQLSKEQWSVSFQSRLGRTPWIRPYTDEILKTLAQNGKKRIGVICPSFVSDCLETLEEIAIRGRETFLSAGGQELIHIPCPNDDPDWIKGFGEHLEKFL